MSEDIEFTPDRKEDGEFVVGTIEIQLVLNEDGEQTIWMRHFDNGDDNLPLITVLGMLDMARDTAYVMAREGDSDDE